MTTTQAVTIHGTEYLFTTEGGQDRATCGIIGSLWLDNTTDDGEDDGHPAREWMAYVREGGVFGRYLIGGVTYNWEDAETELAPLARLVA